MLRNDRQQRMLTYAIVASVLLHVIFFLLMHFTNALESLVFASAADAEQETLPPIVLEFEQPEAAAREPQPPPQSDDFFRIVENPEADDASPEATNLIAENASVSAAPDVTEPGNSPVPYLERPVPDPSEAASDAENSNAEELAENIIDLNEIASLSGSYLLSNPPVPEFDKELLGKESGRSQRESRKEKRREEDESRGLTLFQKQYQASYFGPYRMSTYAWEWAPWLREFEKRYWSHWYEPAGYAMFVEGRTGGPTFQDPRSSAAAPVNPGFRTHQEVGLMEGITTVRLKISRDGERLEFEFLEHEGHESIRISNLGSFDNMFPVKPLPDHFPDEFLELWIRVVVPNFAEVVREYREQLRQQRDGK